MSNNYNSNNFILGISPTLNTKPSEQLINHLRNIENSSENIINLNQKENKKNNINNTSQTKMKNVVDKLITELENEVSILNAKISLIFKFE